MKKNGFDFQTAKLRPPYSLRRGRAVASVSLLGSNPEGSGAPRGASAVRAASLRIRRALAGKFTQSAQTMPKGTRLAALHTHTSLRRVRYLRRLCTPGPCFRARMVGLPPSLIQAAFAALPLRRVQPLKAVPRSRDGRLPGASRTCACEAQARAPHPLPHATTPHDSAPGRRGRWQESARVWQEYVPRRYFAAVMAGT